MDAATLAAVTQIVKENILSNVVVATLLSVLWLGFVLSLAFTYFAKFGWKDRWAPLVGFFVALSVCDSCNNGSCVHPIPSFSFFSRS